MTKGDLVMATHDGALALELRNQGQLEIATRPTGARLRIARYARKGPLLVLGDERDLGSAPVNAPALWGAPYFDWAQFNGSSEQPMRRSAHCPAMALPVAVDPVKQT